MVWLTHYNYYGILELKMVWLTPFWIDPQIINPRK